MKRRAIAAAVVSCALLCGCNPQPKNGATPQPSASASSTPAEISYKITGKGTAAQPVRVVETNKENRRELDLLAKSYQSNGRQGKILGTFQHVHVSFFGKDGTTMTADAPQAVLDQSADTVTLLGGVRARNSAGMLLQCLSLVYDRATEMVHGTGNVVITDPQGMRATGSRLDSDITLTHTQMR